MKKSRFLRLFIGLLVSLILVNAAFAKDEWIEVRSKNFFLVGNAKEKEIRKVATKLEQFREVIRLVLPKLNINSAIPTTVVVFKNNKSYDPYRPQKRDGKADRGVAGYFQPRPDINYITLSTEGESDQTYRIIYHEYMHFLVDNNLGRGRVPSWFNEGLAEYYENFQMENDQKALLGNINSDYLNYLSRTKMMPLDMLFNADYRQMHETGGEGRTMYYAQSWALLHYLLQGNKNRTPQMNQFLGYLMAGNDARTAFKAAFQTDYETLEKELADYVRQRKFMATAVTFKEKLVFESDIKTLPISEAESLAYLGDLLLHSHRHTEAAEHLEKSLSINPDLALANAALGRVYIEQNRPAEAKKLLEKALSLDNNNYLINYYYGETLFSEHIRPGAVISQIPTEDAAKIRNALKRAIELKPDYAEAYRMLAFVNLVNDTELDQAVAYLQKAMTILPGNEGIAYILGQIYMRQKNFAESRKIFANLVQTASDPGLRASAQNFLGIVEQIESRADEIRIYQMQGGDDANVAPPEPAGSREEAENRMFNSMLRKMNPGEERAVGYLTKVTCPKEVIYTIRTDAKVLTLTSKDFENLEMINYDKDLTDFMVGCDTIKKEYYVLVTYKPTANAKAKTGGEVVALEFLPATFKLLE